MITTIDRIAAYMLLAKNPERRKTPYTWLGKRMYGLCEIIDGIENIFTPKNHWARHSWNLVFWEVTRKLEDQIARDNERA